MFGIGSKVETGVGLADTLEKVSDDRLASLLKSFPGGAAGNLITNRTDLLAGCIRAIHDHPLWMTTFFAMLTREMWGCLEAALDRGRCRVTSKDVVTKSFSDQAEQMFKIIYDVFALFPYAQVSPLAEESFNLEIAREVCELWKANHKSLFSYRERANRIDALASAAANLYGTIVVDDLREIYFYYHASEDDVWTRGMFEILYIRSMLERDRYKILDDEIVHYALWNNRKKLDAIRDAHNEEDPWVPETERGLLAYAKDDEFAHTQAMDAFIQYQRESGLASFVLKDLARQVSCNLRENFGDEDIFKVSMSVYSQLADEDPATLAHLLTGVRNTTRTWMNFGHTANEVGKDREVTTEMAATDEIRRFMDVDDAGKLPFVGDKKPGRNDLCPCGSGKKYKKCCGRGT